MEAFNTLTSIVAPVLVNDIDTDQIIPARFLKGIDKVGLGSKLFYDWRYTPEGHPNPDFILNQSPFNSARVLLAGDNFACGSSREHAPWALADFGIRAIISTSFADIFFNNAQKNGLVPVVVPPAVHQSLVQAVTENPQASVTVDLPSQTLTLPDGSQQTFEIHPFSKHCLLNGMDDLDYILSFSDQIQEYEKARQTL
jgi:3-isopropylmalate/(R)-2-methylmalate dehydratase small subunit